MLELRSGVKARGVAANDPANVEILRRVPGDLQPREQQPREASSPCGQTYGGTMKRTVAESP